MTKSELGTPEQRAAIESPARYVEIIAGPGTGKTFTLAHRIAAQIGAGADPARLLAASFTNDACRALRAMLSELVGDAAEKVQVTTFHSFARSIAEQSCGFLQVADEWDTRTLLKGLKPRITPNKVNNLPLDVLGEFGSFNEYMQRLKSHGLVDFRHLLLHAQKLARSASQNFDQIFVDEFQDTNAEQFEFLREFIAGNDTLAVTVVGDPNQAIYGHLGNQGGQDEFSPFEAFSRLGSVATHRLTHNFRASQALVEFTNSVMPIPAPQTSARDQRGEAPKSLVSLLSEDQDAVLVEQVRAAHLKFPSVAVLAYTNKAVGYIIELLKRAQIPWYTGFNKAIFDEPNSRLVYLLFRYIKQANEVQMLSFLDQTRILTPAPRAQLQKLSLDFTTPILDQVPNLKRCKSKEVLERLRWALALAKIELEVATSIEDVRNAVESVLRAVPGAEFDRHVERLFEVLETQRQEFDPALPLVPQFMQHLHSMGSKETNAVSVRTIHSSKGLEWSAVLMPYLGPGDMRRFYQPWIGDKGYHKALYVGMTRARDELTMLSAGRFCLVEDKPCKVEFMGARPQLNYSRILFPNLFGPVKFKVGVTTARRWLR